MSFIWSFVISITSFIGLIILGIIEQSHESISSFAALLAIISIIAGPVWYISLGMIAKRLGRRWFVWVGLSIITPPIGPIVIFPLMLAHVRAARQEISTHPAAE